MRIWKKIKADDLMRHSALLFASMLVAHASNAAFQMVVGRKLPKEEYALLAAFLAALMIIQRPLGTLRTALCHYGSLLEQEGRRGDVKRLLRKWLALTAIPSLAAGILAIVFRDPLATFFHLDRSAPVVIAGTVLPALCWLPILNGAAQGLQMFRWTASSAIIGSITRLVLGGGFTVILYRACGWAMLGHGLSLFVTTGIVFIGLWLVLHGRETSSAPLPSMRFYLFQSFFVQAAYAVLMTADVVLVKHYLPDDTEFSFAATLSRMVVALPGVIVLAMFPKVASKGALTLRQRTVFFRSFWYTALFVVLAIIGCALFSELLTQLLFGRKVFSPEFSQVIVWMTVVMGLSALLNVNVQFLLAQRRFKACLIVITCAVGYVVCANFVHQTTGQIVAAAAVFNAFALVISGISVACIKTVSQD
jgi:O-antigen/teichoic acid export membrane protein